MIIYADNIYRKPKKVYISELKVPLLANQNIIQESINKVLLTEDRESKSRDAARRKAFRELGNKQEADRLVEKVRSDLGLYNNAAAFTYAGVRMYFNNEYDDSTKEKLASVIRLIADKYLNQYDRDLNELSAQELIAKHSPEVQVMRDDERNKVRKNKYSGKSDYQIVRIDSYEQAEKYGEYTNWCVTYEREYYVQYTSNGLNQFYFCLKNGFEQVPKEQGNGYPLDEYGLSMFAVLVNENGDLISCATRWNLNDDRDQHAMNAEEISNVIQMPFYDVFKPNTTWRDALANAMQRLANGERPEDVFDYCEEFDEEEDFAVVELNERCNFINQNGQLISDLPTASESIRGKWFQDCLSFDDGLGVLAMNYKYNYVDQNGKILYKPNEPNQWFDDYRRFFDGFAAVNVNQKWNFIDKNGELLWKKPIDQWFKFCYNFHRGFAKVIMDNGECYSIDKNCNLALSKRNQW